MGSKKASVVGTAPTLTPQQEGLLNQNIDLASKALGRTNLDITQNPAYQSALQSAGSFLQPFDKAAAGTEFDETVGAPAIAQFLRTTRPEMVSQGLYGSGSRNTSALDLALADAQKSLTSDLSSLKSRSLSDAYNSYATRQLQGTALQAELVGMPLQTLLPFLQLGTGTKAMESIVEPGRQGFGSQLLGGLAGSIPAIAGGLAGGSAGAALGAKLGFGAAGK